MAYLTIFLFALLASTGLLLLVPLFFRLALTTVGHLDLLLDPALEEEVKHRRMIPSAFGLLGRLLVFVAGLSGVIVLSLLPFVVATGRFDPTTYNFSPGSTPVTLVAYLLGGGLPFAFPAWLAPAPSPKNGYGSWQRLLHRLILDNQNLGWWLFQRETKRYRVTAATENRPFLVVTGLARAGTTAMTRLLFGTGSFASLSYRHMPFLLAPSVGERLSPDRANERVERVHGDGVFVDFTSVEALEEYFFRVRARDTYLADDRLLPDAMDEAGIADYRAYRAAVVGKTNRVYLAKNNNFVLRYPTVRAAEPGLLTVWMLREPLAQAASLLRQHRRLSHLQTEDGFVTEYMDWLVHHEFGLHHRPFALGETEENKTAEYGRDTIDYWLTVWIAYHRHLTTLLPDPQILLVTYDRLLNDPNGCRNQVLSALGISSVAAPDDPPFVKPKQALPGADSALLTQAMALYHRLLGQGSDGARVQKK